MRKNVCMRECGFPWNRLNNRCLDGDGDDATEERAHDAPQSREARDEKPKTHPILFAVCECVLLLVGFRERGLYCLSCVCSIVARTCNHPRRPRAQSKVAVCDGCSSKIQNRHHNHPDSWQNQHGGFGTQRGERIVDIAYRFCMYICFPLPWQLRVSTRRDSKLPNTQIHLHY